jgi:AcrR family transcriptional regulator
MPGIARAAGVSEATAYRHFPDLLAVLQEGFVGVWPSTGRLMPDLSECPDPIERVAAAAEALGRNVLKIEGAVRTMIALTIARPDATDVRPAHRLALIESALQPLASSEHPWLDQLRNDLAVVISAEALFTLLDVKKLSPDDAVASMVATARSVVRAALDEVA